MLNGLKTRFTKPEVPAAQVLLFSGLALILATAFSGVKDLNQRFLLGGFLLFLTGSGWLIFKRFRKTDPANLQHFNWFRSLSARGVSAWLLGFFLTGFYVVLYWFPASLNFLIKPLDPFSFWLRNKPADNWFLYGALYSLAEIPAQPLPRFPDANKYFRTIGTGFFTSRPAAIT